MLRTWIHRSILFSIVSFISLSLSARTFKNAYISFEMLDTWNCRLEQTEWVCRADDPNEAKEAVIILTAKEKGPTDSLPLYQSHMDNSIVSTTKTGTSLASRVVYKSNQVKYNDQLWLDGLHQDSEVKNYFTRYLATVKDQIAILVTFSAHKNFYAKHSKHFNDTIKSIRVIASKDLFQRPDMGPIRGQGDQLGIGGGQNMPGDLLDAEGDSAGGKKGLLDNELLLGLGLLVLAAILYIVFKVLKNRS